MPLYPSFVYISKANQLVGTVVEPASTLVQVDAAVRDAFVAAAQGVALDLLPSALVDLAKAGFANVAGVALTFSGTTAITLDLTNLIAATGVVPVGAGTFAGSFAHYQHLLLQNTGVAAKILTLSPGSSNPLTLPFSGTTPTYALAGGDAWHYYAATKVAVSSGAKTITITPTSAGTALLFIAGD